MDNQNPAITTEDGLKFTPEIHELKSKIETIFMPGFVDVQNEAGKRTERLKFVHYTSAEAALKIIESKRLWMRNVRSMSDFREVYHGYDLLDTLLQDKERKDALTTAMDACAAGAFHEALRRFNEQWDSTQFQTYVTSISEHLSPQEDRHGRLSMWRAFGGNPARVALVFDIPDASAVTSHLKVHLYPVVYCTQAESIQQLGRIIENINKNQDYLRTFGHQGLVQIILHMLRTIVTCSKHEGFKEEREWRAIYSPNRASSDLMHPATVVLNGIPQIVHQLPVDINVSPLLAEIDFPNIFDRLIIGPTPYTFPMAEAFEGALRKAGVPDSTKRVFASGIPIRA